MSSAMEQASAIPESNKMSEQQLKQVSTDRPWLLGLCLNVPLCLIAPRHLGCKLHVRGLCCLADVSLVSSMMLTTQQFTDWQARCRLACAGPGAQAQTDFAAHVALPGRVLSDGAVDAADPG